MTLFNEKKVPREPWLLAWDSSQMYSFEVIIPKIRLQNAAINQSISITYIDILKVFVIFTHMIY